MLVVMVTFAKIEYVNKDVVTIPLVMLIKLALMVNVKVN